MKIYKIFNNNVVSIIENDKEVIVMGKGIAYKKKVNDEFDESLIDKKFYLKNTKEVERYEKMAESIPIEYFEFGNEVANFARISLNKNLSDTLSFSIADHIYMAISRIKDGVPIKNPMVWELKRFYKNEYDVSLKVLEMIEETFNVKMPEDEAGFITSHIVDSELDDASLNDVYEITNLIQEISNIVKYFFNIEYDRDSVDYYRFITHIRYFAQRVVLNTVKVDEKDDELFEIIKQKYVNASKCVDKIEKFIFDKYHYQISNNEKLYLMIHIERVAYK